MLVRTQSVLATVLAIGVVGAIHAQTPAASQPGTAAGTAAQHDGASPEAFVRKAAQDGLTEVTLGKQAATKAQDPKVKQFADHMVQDHSKANDELTNLATRKGLQVPSSLDAEHQAIVQKMSGKSGADFDAAYTQEMLKDHKKAVALFQGASKSSDADLAAFAQKTLPTLKEHEQMAQQLPGAMHSASTTDSPSRKQ